MSAYDQVGFAQRVMWCYLRTQNLHGGYVTLAEYGAMVAREEGREKGYAASTAQAWMVPGGSMPDPPAQLAIARLAHVDPGWLTYSRDCEAPAPEGWREPGTAATRARPR